MQQCRSAVRGLLGIPGKVLEVVGGHTTTKETIITEQAIMRSTSIVTQVVRVIEGAHL
ncbi:MAG: hypothetical protein ABII24_02680 [bacterium]